MNIYYLTFKSITTAQRAVRALEQAGISVQLIRTPKNLIAEGCGYSIKIAESKFNAAIIILNSSRIDYNRVFIAGAGGSIKEVPR